MFENINKNKAVDIRMLTNCWQRCGRIDIRLKSRSKQHKSHFDITGFRVIMEGKENPFINRKPGDLTGCRFYEILQLASTEDTCCNINKRGK